ncbi:Spy/CpxP family protein refolding chaperone [Commensalibacter oyaizuii]|uniref:Spy/CpxP family protein refolding chaperone n=1 Tax=Commensalibacter oyaizuii TaxID=3043873 RepID=A0ABT6PZZ5_9PROT|nr:Spy/CpxP family protein refolding chaperone [Commensalibacter sp. TBRC 16381]MDI2090437.1 Spy/CpxP family protein refolding chaperone [Commensalibacter sp. TBRC 16381]
MFNKKLLTSMVVASGLSLGAVGSAWAQPADDAPPPPPPPPGEMPPPHHPGMFGPEVGPMGMIFKGIQFTKEQKKQIHDILAKARADERANHQDMKAIHNELATALLSPGKVTKESLKPILDKQTALEEATKDRHLTTLLALRDVLTPQQLAQAKVRYGKLQEIRKQMKQLHKQIRDINEPAPAAE